MMGDVDAAPTEGTEPRDLEARRAIEAIVMVTDEPADPRLLAQLTEISADRVEEICESLAQQYRDEQRGFELVKVAGGWRFQSCADMSPYVERFVLSGQSARLSAAALETLAIVAYKQPISRAQVAAIRGVNVDGVMRTLQQRGYIAELARDPGPGQAVLFGTTSTFLEKLGLNSIEELPALGEFVPSPDVLEALEQGLLVGDAPDVEDAGDAETEDGGPAVDLAEAEASQPPVDLTDRVDLRDGVVRAEQADAPAGTPSADGPASPSGNGSTGGSTNGHEGHGHDAHGSVDGHGSNGHAATADDGTAIDDEPLDAMAVLAEGPAPAEGDPIVEGDDEPGSL